jgi:hypothetical protein
VRLYLEIAEVDWQLDLALTYKCASWNPNKINECRKNVQCVQTTHRNMLGRKENKACIRRTATQTEYADVYSKCLKYTLRLASPHIVTSNKVKLTNNPAHSDPSETTWKIRFYYIHERDQKRKILQLREIELNKQRVNTF